MLGAVAAIAYRQWSPRALALALVAQNRADRAGWRALIRWMQDKHGLWPLGEFEAPILDYLETHYAPAAVGRRRPLAPALMPEVTTGDKR